MIGISEKKVVCISSLPHIVLFGFVCDSGKKTDQLKKAGLWLAMLQGIFQVHLSEGRTGHDTKNLVTLYFHLPSMLKSLSAQVGGALPELLGMVVDH